jgi:LPS-assembly protein
MTPVQKASLRLLPLCLAISFAVHAQTVEKKPDWLLCRNPETLPLFIEPVENPGDRDLTPTDIAADNLNVKKDDVTVFEGKVELRRADQWLASDKLTYFHKTQTFNTEGPVRYQDKSVRLTADEAKGDQKTDTMEMTKVTYQFSKELGNGTAADAKMKGSVGELTAATYSTCPPGQRQWEFSASSIRINQDTETGVAHNATLKLGRIPVLWLPVVSFPTTDERRSGVLMPTIGRDDRNGFDLKLPYYLNLAPNYDATLTPRWLSKRGLMLGAEFRYMGVDTTGSLSGAWLPNDKITGNDRGSFNWNQITLLDPHWTFAAGLNHVSDESYFSDFGDSLRATSTTLLDSAIGVFGRGLNWSASLSAESWQITTPVLSARNAPFRRLPRALAEWHKPITQWLDVGVQSEAVRFVHDTLPLSGNRLDLRPYVSLNFGGSAWYVNPQLAWRYTSYSLDSGTSVPLANSSPTRSLPIFSLDTGATFEREFNFHDNGYVQTLEPRLFYLRVPFRNQDDIPLFDTRNLTFGWTSLFRDNTFGGADRQSDANQLSGALTTRFLSDSDGRELISASIGRIHYFDTPQVTLTPSHTPVPSIGGSPWVLQVDTNLSDRWNAGVIYQWDPDNHRTELSSVHGQYFFGQGGIINAAYRYRRNDLEQTDLSFVIPVGTRWNLYGRWNYSLRDRQTLEALGGMEWKSCCVAVRLLGRQYIRSATSRRNLGLYLEIELNGLGSFGRSTARLLDDAILGYSEGTTDQTVPND